MKHFILWLGRNKLIAILLAIMTYFSIVTFHDEITQVAIKMRNAIGRDQYNAYLAYGFLALLLMVVTYFTWKIYSGQQKMLNIILAVMITVMMLFSFRFLMVYNIEAIHFVEYAILAIILLPVFRSYGETVFWVTLLGMLDELFQYIYLVPEFEYFDFNDNVLNLLGAGLGVIIVHTLGGNILVMKKLIWYRSPAILTGIGLLLLFFILQFTGKMTINPTVGIENWFSLNRATMPAGEFWKEAYPGRR
ncbi:MAG: VanZ family protein, partial [Bacteroidales bacterium]|nr:VanZ family protein [Bacteroidales bacterium]